MMLAAETSNAADIDNAQALVKAQRYKEAWAVLLPMANGGNDEAQRIIGEMAYLGQGVNKNYEAARRWTELAAGAGNPIAQYNLGYLYERGEGAPRSTAMAIEWYKKAALRNYTPAQRKLGDLYASRDEESALYWYDQARQLGDEEARKKFSALSSANIAAKKEQDRTRALEKAENDRIEEEKRRADLEEVNRKIARANDSDDSPAAPQPSPFDGLESINRITRNTLKMIAQNEKSKAETRQRAQAGEYPRGYVAASPDAEHPMDRQTGAAIDSRSKTASKNTDSTLTLTAVELSKPADMADYSRRKREPHPSYVEPNPYGEIPLRPEYKEWAPLSAGEATSRAEACNIATSKGKAEIARLPSHLRLDGVTQCFCRVNYLTDQSVLDAMARTNEPDHWLCTQYRKVTAVGNTGINSSR